MAFNQYTKCVEPADYSGPFLGSAGFWAAFLASLAVGFIDPGATVLGLILTAIAYCRWWLYGRLVCLGGDKCFIGLALQVDTPADQSGIGKIDTDYSLYVLPAPSPLLGDTNWLADMPATNDIQGYLVENQSATNSAFAQMMTNYPSLTFTGEPETSYALVNHDGSSVLTAGQANALNLPTPPGWQANNFYTPGDTISDSNGNLQTVTPYAQALSGANPPSWPTAVGATVYDGSIQWSCGGPVPALGTLEIEFEGAGVWDLYQALLVAAGVAAAAAVVCAIPVFGWIACLILSLIAVAISGAGMIIALNDDSAQTDANTQVGVIHPGQDILFVSGTWIYDSAHTGWNELHPVKFCQIIGQVPQADLIAGKPWNSLPQFNEANLAATIAGYCGLAQNALAPPTIQAQGNPENGWTLHPTVDGCTPNTPPPPLA
jgi:hypothetical protein